MYKYSQFKFETLVSTITNLVIDCEYEMLANLLMFESDFHCDHHSIDFNLLTQILLKSKDVSVGVAETEFAVTVTFVSYKGYSREMGLAIQVYHDIGFGVLLSSFSF